MTPKNNHLKKKPPRGLPSPNVLDEGHAAANAEDIVMILKLGFVSDENIVDDANQRLATVDSLIDDELL